MSTMRSGLPLGSKLAGIVADQTEGTPWLSGELTISPTAGILLEVPFVYGPDGEQFEAAQRWFRQKTGPAHLAFQAPGHTVGLYGCTYSWGSTGSGASIVRVHVDTAVLRPSSEVDEHITATGVTSLLDGLREWTRLSSVAMRVDTDGHHSTGPRATISVAATAGPSWRDGDLELSISTRWFIPQERAPLAIHDDAALRSLADYPIPLDEHLQSHRAVRNLVSLIFATPVHYRGHELTHPSFAPAPFGPREDPDMPPSYATEFFHHTTVADEAAPIPASHAFLSPLVQFDEVGAAGLEAWAGAARSHTRAIALTVGVLRRQPVIEDLLINSCMAMEALGRGLDRADGEERTLNRGNPTFTTYALRCFARAGFTSETFGVPLPRLARAISRRYANTKHPNTTGLPDSRETLVLAKISLLAMRICLAMLATRSGAIAERRGIERDVGDCLAGASQWGIELVSLVG